MSVQSEIDRIKANVSAAYSAVGEKGGTLPAVQNSANLAAAMRSVSVGMTQGEADGRYLKLTGGSITGAVTVQAPNANMNPATKKYVDDLVGDVASLLDSINGEVA